MVRANETCEHRKKCDIIVAGRVDATSPAASHARYRHNYANLTLNYRTSV